MLRKLIELDLGVATPPPSAVASAPAATAKPSAKGGKTLGGFTGGSVGLICGPLPTGFAACLPCVRRLSLAGQ